MSENLIRTMSGQITARIREKILTGVYPPGSALLQDVIAAEFGVSKIPVREALVQLRAEGLVDVFAHRGFQVRPLSSLEVDEVFRLRSQIEPAAVAEGSRRAKAEDHDATRLLIAGAVDESGAFLLAKIFGQSEVQFGFNVLNRIFQQLHRNIGVGFHPEHGDFNLTKGGFGLFRILSFAFPQRAGDPGRPRIRARHWQAAGAQSLCARQAPS